MATRIDELLDVLRVPPGKKIDLKKDYDPGFTGKWMKKEEAEETLAQGVQLLAEMQDKLYAQDTYALLMVLQAMDAAGKDGTIKHVMSGVNPQGVEVHSYKAPAGEEMEHDYLWRNFIALPRRGHIGIFNRSYYEEVLVVRVHPDVLEREKLPKEVITKKLWKRRFTDISNFEDYLAHNGFVLLKFFLHMSRGEQQKRFLQRLDNPDKNWKFSVADVRERQCWDDYQHAYEDMIRNTATKHAPWYIVPADNKWFTRLVVAGVVVEALDNLKLNFPVVDRSKLEELAEARRELQAG